MSIADQERLRSIVRQLSLPIPGSQQHYENVVVGLTSNDQSVLLYPDEQQSTFAKLFSTVRPQAAIKAVTSTIDVLLADTHPAAPLIHIDENINLPILSSLNPTLETSVTRSAAIVRDEGALLVWSDDARSVAQSFLDLDHRLRHASRQCKCSKLPSLASLRSQADSMPTSSEGDGYLFAPEHNSVGDLTSGLMLAPMELPELDLPFRPLDMAPSTEDYAMVSDEMIDSGAMPLQLQFDDDCGASLGTSYGITYEMLEAAQVSPWRDPLSSYHLLRSRVFSSSSMMAMSAPSHETEPQTVSPSMLHSPYTASSSTLSPSSTSGAPFTPFSSSADPLPSLWSSPPQESQISPTSTFYAGSIAPATKSLGADSDDHVSVYDNSEPYDSQHARYTSRTPPPLRSPSPPSPVIRRAASRRSGPVSVPRPTKRKHGPSQTPQRQAASSSTREVLPLPKRSANRAVVEKSTTTRLHPLPGCNLRSRRSVATEEPASPHPSTMQLGVVVDAAHDDESEDIPIDGDGSDEDDSEYEPSPKKVCVSAGAQRETKKSVTTLGTQRKRGTGGPARRRRGSRTEGGSRRGNFSCTDPECDLVFTRETDMKRHVECVHKKRGVFCPGCNRTYARVDSHRRHLKNGECPKAKSVQRGEPYDEEEHEAESEDDEL